MTHRYNDLNPSDALYIAARSYPGGIEALISAQEYDLLERDIRTCISGLLRLKKKLHVKHMESE